MQGQLFVVVVTERPFKDEVDNGEISKLLLDPIFVIVRDKSHAQTQVIVNHTFPASVDMNRLEVDAFPFG